MKKTYTSVNDILVANLTDWNEVRRIFENMTYHPESCKVWLHPNCSPKDTMQLFLGTKDEYEEYFANFLKFTKNFTPWWDREFSVESRKVLSGPAHGKCHLVFKNKADFTIGYVQPTNLDFQGVGGLVFVTQRSYKNYDVLCAHCLDEAFKFLGVENIDLRDVDHCFNEFHSR